MIGKTMRLTTTGRKSGQSREVRIWFVERSPGEFLVQHTAPKPANWYRNLLSNPAVTFDVGNGPTSGVALVITDPSGIEDVLTRIRSKYLAAWIFRVLGWNKHAVAAVIKATNAG